MLLGRRNQSERAGYSIYDTLYAAKMEIVEESPIARGWVDGWREGRIGRAQSIFRVVKLFCIMVNSCPYVFVNTHRIHNT